ncbi:hypothetical protein [Streptomyces venezuelae]|uniref:hypothetical protein n=1 Tax=Streptomyces venezuelae TaxID=54571 RepID=UPI00123A2FF3|nr:hypothetical protein [Streptomyces venezuelae]
MIVTRSRAPPPTTSTGEADRVTGTHGEGEGVWTLYLPAGTAAVTVTRDGELLGWVATPEPSSATPVVLGWDGEETDAARVRA